MVAGGSLLFLESCSKMEIFKTVEADTFSLPVSAFSRDTYVVISHKEEGNILVRKQGDDQYKALSLACTHREGNVIINKKELKCKRHGSRFDMDGKVLEGPARKDLRQFSAIVENDEVIIKLA